MEGTNPLWKTEESGKSALLCYSKTNRALPAFISVYLRNCSSESDLFKCFVSGPGFLLFSCALVLRLYGAIRFQARCASTGPPWHRVLAMHNTINTHLHEWHLSKQGACTGRRWHNPYFESWRKACLKLLQVEEKAQIKIRVKVTWERMMYRSRPWRKSHCKYCSTRSDVWPRR